MSKTLRIIFLFSALLILIGDNLSLVVKRDNVIFAQNNQEEDDERTKKEKEENKEENKEEKEEKEDKDKDRLYSIGISFNLNANILRNQSYLLAFIFEHKCYDLESPPPEA